MLRIAVLLAGLGAALIISGWQAASGDELLINGGFEAGTTGWDAPYGELTTAGSPAHGGSASGRLAGDSKVTQLAHQWVDVAPSQAYEFSGWVVLDDPVVSKVFLQIGWFDGQGSLLTVVPSPWLSGPDPAFRFLTTGPQISPSRARKASLNVFVQPCGPEITEPCGPFQVYLDDFSFQGSPPGPNPTPTPTPSPEPAVAPTPYPTPALAEPAPTTNAAAEPKSFPSLVNGGFEKVREDGTPYGWRSVGGEMSATDAVRAQGARSAALVSRTESTKWLYQAVTVKTGAYYRLQAKALKNDPGVREALLRISWYKSADGSGNQIETADSEALALDSPGFVALDTGPVQAPPGARSAKLRLLLRPASAARAAVYFDDVRFEETIAPPPTESALNGEQSAPDAIAVPGGSTADASRAPSAGVALSTWIGPTPLANVRRAPEQQPYPSPGKGRPLWPLLLALGVPAAGLAVMAGSARRRARIGGGTKPEP